MLNDAKDSAVQPHNNSLVSHLVSKSINYTIFPPLTNAANIIIDKLFGNNTKLPSYGTIVEYMNEARLSLAAINTLAVANTYSASKWVTQNIRNLVEGYNQQSLEK
ncbi:hypothetical protein Cyrtocomes_00556 [Candidatus Cyrtobacter comes]|uniref:Uncharacterized protein n=1 Tax=Candidatus Cyrtobacter comes TaxID=675776 RepID=A0ABU5L8E3_9RICK|nr:hypothetical protein [Candidatus Cyrtobacter comes]MDZ5762185.1 hypothetical protein [Candidatus Cyrtobacter comes]